MSLKKKAHIVVELAKRATPTQIQSKLKESLPEKTLEMSLKDDTRISLELATHATLSKSEKEWIWDLYERNMKDLLTASQDGYDPISKRSELMHPQSRIVILRSKATGTSLEFRDVGFAIFRFDTEETADDDVECDVLYCYELQIESSRRRTGAAKVLMDALQTIAKNWKMDKVILTVLKSNTDAIAFYERQGFTTDEIDPSFYSQPDVDYRILSRRT